MVHYWFQSDWVYIRIGTIIPGNHTEERQLGSVRMSICCVVTAIPIHSMFLFSFYTSTANRHSNVTELPKFEPIWVDLCSFWLFWKWRKLKCIKIEKVNVKSVFFWSSTALVECTIQTWKFIDFILYIPRVPDTKLPCR